MNTPEPLVRREEAESFLQAAALDTVSAVATAISNPLALAHSAVRLLRAAQRGKFVTQLNAEWAELKAEGHIAHDYGGTDQCRAGLSDILESLEDANFDEEQLVLLRKLFLAAASEQLTDRRSPLPREYLSIGRTLTTGEIELLAQTHRYISDWQALPVNARPNSADSWLDLMQQRTALAHRTLIEMHERKLIEKGLLADRMWSDGSGIGTTAERYRLTDLGYAFCEFLTSYDKMVNE